MPAIVPSRQRRPRLPRHGEQRTDRSSSPDTDPRPQCCWVRQRTPYGHQVASLAADAWLNVDVDTEPNVINRLAHRHRTDEQINDLSQSLLQRSPSRSPSPRLSATHHVSSDNARERHPWVEQLAMYTRSRKLPIFIIVSDSQEPNTRRVASRTHSLATPTG